MAGDEDALWAQFSDPIMLPLVTKVPGGVLDNPALIGAATPPSLTVQLDTLGGKHFLLPLTVAAAQKLVKALAISLQLQGCPIDPESNDPTKAH